MVYTSDKIKQRNPYKKLKPRIYFWLGRNVTEKRLKHIVGVSETAKKYAKKLKLNPNKAEISGLLHDCAKEFTNRQLLSLARKFKIKLDNVDLINPHVLHARVGEYIARREFKVKDKDILAGIRCHTLAEPNMSKLAMTIYLADSTEPSRDKKKSKPLKKIFKEEGLEKAVLAAVNMKLLDVIERGKIVHPYTISARNWLIQKIEK